MFRDEATLLAYESKKNIELKTMIENLDEFSEDDIDDSKLAKWMKVALKKQKNTVRVSELVDSNIETGFVEDPAGKILQWTGYETFLFFGRSQILVNPGDCFFMTKKGIWFDSVFASRPDSRLIKNIALVQATTFSGYKIFRQRQLQSKNPSFDKILPVIDVTGNTSDTASAYYKIYRI